MDAYAVTAQAFHQRIDLIASAVDRMAPGIAAGAQCLVEAVLSDGKVLICAAGDDEALGAYVTTCLRQPVAGGPALPALHLGSDARPGDGATLWRDFRTLSRDGDVLLCIDSSTESSVAASAVRIAGERNLAAITLSQVQLSEVHIPLIADTAALRGELALMAINNLRTLSRLIMLGE